MLVSKGKVAVETVLGIFAVLLCWSSVSWALRPGLFPMLDELATRGVFLLGSYRQIVHFFPTNYYADRPLGWAFIKLMGDWFDFDYTRQVTCLLVLHFANCLLGFWLFRKLGLGIPLAIAGVALFGSLWTTGQTATYLGECFDTTCLFFLLGSTLAMLSSHGILSGVLFLAALRSKEFAIVTPLLLTVLVALRLPRAGLGLALARRLWLHYLILIVFGVRYVLLYLQYRTGLAPDNLYRMDFHITTVLTSLSYYTSLIFGAEESRWKIPAVLLAIVLVLILGWAVFHRRAGITFGLMAYVLTALPVFLMPRVRSAYWVYAPQIFLILALGLLLEEILARVAKREQVRWVAAVCLTVACMAWCVAFRRSDYFRERVRWNVEVRRISARTAREANAQFPPLGPGTHVYVNHASDMSPWLFVPGPCSYLQLINRQASIVCVLNKPADQLRAAYLSDLGPKYFVDYREDGSITVAGGLPR
jgi:hypothetical protein